MTSERPGFFRSTETSNQSGFGSTGFYDSLWATDWFDMERLNPTARHLERMIVAVLRTLGPVDTLLDVGCGIGVNLKRIRVSLPHIRLSGADISAKGIELAKQYVGESQPITYHVLNVQHAALPGKYDVVLCSQVLEHIEDDRHALNNLHEMTGKFLLLTVPGGRFNSTSKLVGHYRHYSKLELIHKVAGAGLEVLWAKDWGFPFHSLYKAALNMLPIEGQKKIGLGRFGIVKRSISHLLFALFYLNLFNYGANVILLARKSDGPSLSR